MTINGDFIAGMITGALIVAIFLVVIGISSCTEVRIYDYPEEKKECVIRYRVIEECYPKTKTE